MSAPPPKRIAVLCLPGIGDAILFTPALRALRSAFPDAHITAVTMFDGAADVLRTNPDLDAVECFDFFHASVWASLRYVLALRRRSFDASILGFPANRLEYNVVNALVGRRWRAAHRYRRQRWRNLVFLNDVVVPESPARHNVEENLALVRALCERIDVPMPAVDTHLTIRLTADDVQRGARFLTERGIAPGAPLVGLHTYSSTFKNMARKCWDQDNFVRLIHRLGDTRPNLRVLVFSGPSDGAVNAHIARHAGARAIVVEEPDVRAALAVLRHCRVFVSNDSALMHLAGALGVPVVALFGPTNPHRLHPWAAAHTVVRRNLPCMPCFEYSSRPLTCTNPRRYACMGDLGVDEVVAATERMLADVAAHGSAALA